MVSTGSRHLSMTACSRILPSQEPRGMSSRCSPRGVIFSLLSSASIVLRFCTALRMMRKGGGSGTLDRKSAMGMLGGDLLSSPTERGHENEEIELISSL